MRPNSKTNALFILLYLLTGCSNDFLNENLTPDSFTLGISNLYISPDWESSNYLFMLPPIKEADYEIVSKPSWLNVGSVNGQLSDSMAVVHCSASRNLDFQAVGVYLDFMTVRADGLNYKVPVAYITEGNPEVQVQSTLTLSYNNNYNPNLSIQNIGYGILLWEIISMPDWLVVDTNRLDANALYLSPYETFNLPLRFKLDSLRTGVLTGTVVIATNDKVNPSVTINVTANLGTPQLDLNTNTVDFSYTETSKTLNLYNYGDGMLVWEFKDIPSWLTITPSSGEYAPYTSGSNIIFSCDRTKLLPGQNTAIITLITNDSSHPSSSIKVIANAPGNTENIRVIDGNIVDALFNENTNTLYFVSSQPNKFVAYDVIERTVLYEIELSKAPTSFAISEDWAKAAIGHNGYISALNLSGNTVTATYTLNYSVNDIAWAENDWFCYTQLGDSFSSLHWINIADGDLYDSPDTHSLDGKSIVKKVPNQPYIIATRNSSSPSGFFAYDIATKSKKSYAHMDLTNFWFSQDGEYIFARNLNIYRTTSSTESTDTFDADINAIGKITTGNDNYYGLQYIYHANNYLWALQNDNYYIDASTSIYQIEDNDYTLVKSYDYDLYYQPDEQSTPLSISANFIFANKEGTEIAVLCKSTSNDLWLIQFITVE